MRIAVDDENLQLLLRVESEIRRRVAREAGFFERDLARVRARLTQPGLKSQGRFRLPRHGNEFLFFVLSVDAELGEHVLELALAKVCHGDVDL